MSVISIQLLSDLHLKTDEYTTFNISPVADTLAILGDIGFVNDCQLPDYLRSLTLRFRRVLYVLGNNEFHYSSHVCNSSLRRKCDFFNLCVSMRPSIVFNGLRQISGGSAKQTPIWESSSSSTELD